MDLNPSPPKSEHYDSERALQVTIFAVLLIVVALTSLWFLRTRQNSLFTAGGIDTSLVLGAESDVYIASDNPDTNFGSEAVLEAQRFEPHVEGGKHKAIFLRFDLSDLDTSKQLEKAVLKFTTDSFDGSAKGVRLIPDTGWVESGATYTDFVVENSSLLSFQSYQVVATFLAQKGTSEMDGSGNVSLNLSSSISPLLGSKFVVVIEDYARKPFRMFSKESASAKPRLELQLQAKATDGANFSAATTLKPELGKLDSIIKRPLAGLYSWKQQGGMFNVNAEQSADVYHTYDWAQLEPAKDKYDFSAIAKDIARLQPGQKLGFRVRAMGAEANLLPSWMNVSPYIQTEADCATAKVPNWNNKEFQDRVTKLLSKLGENYNNTRTSFVDIGIYGKLGEWQMNGFPKACAANEASLKTFLDGYVRAFPQVQLVMPYASPILPYALDTIKANSYGFIGVRADTVGEEHGIFSTGMTADYNRLKSVLSRWQTAPIITEFFGVNGMRKNSVFNIATAEAKAWHIAALANGNTFPSKDLDVEQKQQFNLLANTLGYHLAPKELQLTALRAGASAKLKASWINNGVAPVYEPWKVEYLLINNKDQNQRFSLASGINLRELLPTTNPVSGKEFSKEYSDDFTLPHFLPAGSYSFKVRVVDGRPQDRRNPLPLLLNMPRGSDGYYTLGDVDIAAADPSMIPPPKGVTAPAKILVTQIQTSQIVEGGKSGNLGLSLGSQPAAPVTITMVVNDQVKTLQKELVFSTSNWNKVQAFTIQAIDDNQDESETHYTVITFKVTSSDPRYNNFKAPQVQIKIQDND